MIEILRAEIARARADSSWACADCKRGIIPGAQYLFIQTRDGQRYDSVRICFACHRSRLQAGAGKLTSELPALGGRGHGV